MIGGIIMKNKLMLFALSISMLLIACVGNGKRDVESMIQTSDTTKVEVSTDEDSATEASTESEDFTVELNPLASRQFDPYRNRASAGAKAEAIYLDMSEILIQEGNSVTANSDWDEDHLKVKRVGDQYEVAMTFVEELFQNAEPQFNVGQNRYKVATYYNDGKFDISGYNNLMMALLYNNPVEEKGREFIGRARMSYDVAIEKMIEASNGILTKEFLKAHTSTDNDTDNYFVFYDMKDANPGYSKEYYVISPSPFSYEANVGKRESSTDLDELLAETQMLYEN